MHRLPSVKEDDRVLHHIIMKNLRFFLWEFRKFEQKVVLGHLGYSEKHQILNKNRVLATWCEEDDLI